MQISETDDSDTIIGLADLARIVVSLRWYILSGAALGLAAAVTVSLLLTPVYRAEVVAMPVDNTRDGSSLSRLAGQFGGLAALAGVSMQTGTNRDEAIAVLKSRQFALQMIDDLRLLPVLFADRWDPEARQWRTGLLDEAPTSDDAWRLWDKSIRDVLDDRDRGLIVARIEWRDHAMAAAWANQLISRLNQTLRSRRLDELDRSIRFLETELDRAQIVELRAAIAQVMQSQISERMLAKVREEFALKVIDPALPMDADRPIRPRPALYAFLGLSAGTLLGFAIGLLVLYVQSNKRPSVRH